MGLQLVIGRSGTGKTTCCMNSIATKQSLSEKRLVLVVPEQYSSEAERDLISHTNGKGILTAEVLSFGRLAHSYLQKIGMNKKTPLGDIGKSMALRKILNDLNDRLLFFKKAVNKQGFVEQLGQSVTEFCQYRLSPEDLMQQCLNLDISQAMREKLHDLSLIYSRYLKFVNERYLLADSMLDILSDILSKITKIEAAEIWIDGFYGFTPQEYETIAQLIRLADNVYITLTMDEKSFMKDLLPINSPFFEAHITKNKLYALANDMNAKIFPPVIFSQNLRSKTKGLVFLEDNFLNHFGKVSPEFDGIKIIKARNRDFEIRRTAEEILCLVRDNGLRYRDIAIVTNAIGEYEKSLCGILEEYNIPYFIDRKREIISHPLVNLVSAILDVFVYNFRYEAMFAYLKTGLSPLSISQTDRLENYVLASGIKGHNWFNENRWKKGILGSDEELEKIIESRNLALAPLLDFKNNFDKNKLYPASEIADAILDILYKLDVEDKLTALADASRIKLNEAKAREHLQILNIVMELFDKASEILGDEKMTLATFQKIIQSGIAQSTLGIIPPTADSLLVGDLERTRLPELTALFVLGANDGILPGVTQSHGVWTDRERSTLEKLGTTLGNDSKKRTFLEQYLIYLSITKPKTSLTLSYCAANLEGGKMQPSPILSRFKNMFPNLVEIDDELKEDIFGICSQTACLHKLGAQLYNGAQGLEIDTIWQDVYSFLYEDGNIQHKLLNLRSALLSSNVGEKLTRPVLNKMMKGTLYTSVSQLELYASCPFAYFAQYGLKAKERRLYELRLPDLGLLFHTVLEYFSKIVINNNMDWFSITKPQTEALIDAAMDEAAPMLGNQVLFDTAANRYLINRLKRISKRAAWTLMEHVQMGDFKPSGFELGFGNNEALPPIVIGLSDGQTLVLRGKIDRIDLMDKNQKRYVKIIDYKSGSKEFNFGDIYYGLQLQLLIYLDAYLKTDSQNNKLYPGGVFYFQLKDNAVTITNDMTAEEIYTMLFKDMRMSGLALSEPEVICGIDKVFGSGEDGRLSKGASTVIPVAVNSDGSFRKGTTAVADAQKYQKLMAFAITRAKQAGEGIIGGEIAPLPIRRNGASPCSYCKYISICGFMGDDSSAYRFLKDIDTDTFWAAIDGNDDDILD